VSGTENGAQRARKSGKRERRSRTCRWLAERERSRERLNTNHKDITKDYFIKDHDFSVKDHDFSVKDQDTKTRTTNNASVEQSWPENQMSVSGT